MSVLTLPVLHSVTSDRGAVGWVSASAAYPLKRGFPWKGGAEGGVLGQGGGRQGDGLLGATTCICRDCKCFIKQGGGEAFDYATTQSPSTPWPPYLQDLQALLAGASDPTSLLITRTFKALTPAQQKVRAGNSDDVTIVHRGLDASTQERYVRVPVLCHCLAGLSPCAVHQSTSKGFGNESSFRLQTLKCPTYRYALALASRHCSAVGMALACILDIAPPSPTPNPSFIIRPLPSCRCGPRTSTMMTQWL